MNIENVGHGFACNSSSTHSMYIDAVAEKANVSSYSEDSKPIKVEAYADSIQRAFKKIQSRI